MHGYSVAEAATTDAALPLLDSAEVVTTGLLVGGSISSVELMQWIRSRWSNADKPILVVTACAAGGHDRCGACGVRCHPAEAVFTDHVAHGASAAVAEDSERRRLTGRRTRLWLSQSG